MSKSLKNFVTIQDALKQYSANQIRLVFLIHAWDSVLDYKEESLKRVVVLEQTFQKFFLGSRSLIQEQMTHPIPFDGNHNFHDVEKDLLKEFLECQTLVHVALCDSFDTPTVISHLAQLVSQTNVYMSNKARDGGGAKVNAMLLERVAQWITKILGVFGMSVEQTGLKIGFSLTTSTPTGDVRLLFWVEGTNDERRRRCCCRIYRF
jgi:cysteinyl-tRNA synthetase